MSARPGLIAKTAIVSGPAGRREVFNAGPVVLDYTGLVERRPR
jgi:hypothetical protein